MIVPTQTQPPKHDAHDYATMLTKREYAAIQICAAMRANGDRWRGTDETSEDYARSAVHQADALLAELAKPAT